MRWSTSFIPTLRDDPADAEAISHKLLIRAGFARQLMAAVTLPRRLADPEEIAMGGVSDISNRGPLDRLLLTELVHDDLTLAVRVSSNEALYLRRESPPRDAWREFSISLSPFSLVRNCRFQSSYSSLSAMIS